MGKAKRGSTNDWQKSLFWLGLSFVNFEGLANFILFSLILAAIILWLVYQFAQIIIPALLVVLTILAGAFVPFHYWSKATLRTRSYRRIATLLQEIREQERISASRQKVLPLEQRISEAAQALADHTYARSNSLSKVSQDNPKARQEQRTLNRDLEDLRLTYSVVPDRDRWCRFFRLHLERDWIRWMAEHPRPAGLIVLSALIVLTTVVAAVLPRVS